MTLAYDNEGETIEELRKELAIAHQEIAALKADAEPVAWYYPEDVTENTRFFKVATTNNANGTMVPLYTHPAPPVSDEPCAKCVCVVSSVDR